MTGPVETGRGSLRFAIKDLCVAALAHQSADTDPSARAETLTDEIVAILPHTALLTPVKQYPASWHGDLTRNNIEVVALLLHRILEGETFSTVAIDAGGVALGVRPKVLTRQYLDTHPSLTGDVIHVAHATDGDSATLTISTQVLNWYFTTDKTSIVYERGRQIYFERENGAQIVFRLDED